MNNLPVKPLLSTAEVQKHFAVYGKQLAQHERQLVNLSVNNDQEADIALQQIKSAKDLVKTVTTVSKELKAPYQETVKTIDSYFKKFLGSINSAINVAGTIVLNYKTVQAQKLKEEAEKNLESVSKESVEGRELLDKITRIAETTKARIFGGLGWKRGVKTFYEGVNTIEECEALLESIESTFPDITTFRHMAPTIAMIKELSINTLNTMCIDIRKGFAPDRKFLNAIYTEKVNAEILGEEKRLKKQELASKKKVIQAPSMVMKGTRKTIQFKLTDKSRVPLNYLEVDEKAVNEYISLHRDAIKKRLDAADDKAIELIGGISFYYEKKVVG